MPKQSFREMLKMLKIKLKLKGLRNWPELKSYCGCCKLSTGIYIRSFFTVILFIGLMALVTINLIRIRTAAHHFFHDTNKTALEEQFDIVISDDDIESVVLFYKAVLLFHILWICFKCFYILKTLFTVYAIYRRNPKLIKSVLYCTVPSSLFDFLLTVIGFFLFNPVFKLGLIGFYVSELYNILAINSEYKRITGKSKIIPDELIGDPTVEQQGRHCRSCTCFNRFARDSFTNLTDTTDVMSANSDNSSEYVTNNTDNGQEQHANINTNIKSRPDVSERPDSLDLNLAKKEETMDSPTIYDQDQLNVNGSPVIV